MIYKDFEIEAFFNGYTILFCGDELYFDTIEEAKRFIDGL